MNLAEGELKEEKVQEPYVQTTTDSVMTVSPKSNEVQILPASLKNGISLSPP